MTQMRACIWHMCTTTTNNIQVALHEWIIQIQTHSIRTLAIFSQRKRCQEKAQCHCPHHRRGHCVASNGRSQNATNQVHTMTQWMLMDDNPSLNHWSRGRIWGSRIRWHQYSHTSTYTSFCGKGGCLQWRTNDILSQVDVCKQVAGEFRVKTVVFLGEAEVFHIESLTT